MKKYIGQHIFDYVASFRQNVGVGTDTPSEKLDVVGNIKLQTTAGSLIAQDFGSASVKLTSSGSLGVEAPSNFRVKTGSSLTENFTVLHSGNVGIGNNSPSRNLNIQGTGNTVLSIVSPTSSLVQLALGDTDDDNYGQIILDNSSNKLQIQNGGGGVVSNRGITLDSSENVGINIDSPTEKLHVSGNAIITGDLTVSGTTTTIDTTNLNVEDKNITINYSTGDSSSTADGAGITIQDAVDSSTDATILWDATNDEFDFSHGATFSGAVNFGVDGTGVDVKFFGDTSGRDMFWLQAQDALILKDNTELRVGSGYDLRLSHDGSHSRVKNYNGDLYITQRQDDGDIILQSDDGSGGTTAYITLDGSATTVEVAKATNFASTVTIANDTTITNGLYVNHNDGIQIAESGNASTSRTFLTSFTEGGNSRMKIKGGNYIHSVRFETSKNNFQYADITSSYNGSNTTLNLHKSNSDTTGTDATTTISTGDSSLAGSLSVSGALTVGADTKTEARRIAQDFEHCQHYEEVEYVDSDEYKVGKMLETTDEKWLT